MFKSFSRWVGDSFVDSFADRLLEDKYTENLFNIYSYASKLGVREIMETMLRSSQGKPISRPMGSPVVLSPWYDILFNPVHFVRMPTTEEVEIDTSVVIGKQSRKPLKLDFPVMIAGMSFGGALSEKAKIALAKGASEVGTATNTGEAPLLESERRAAKGIDGTLDCLPCHKASHLPTPKRNWSKYPSLNTDLKRGISKQYHDKSRNTGIGGKGDVV